MASMNELFKKYCRFLEEQKKEQNILIEIDDEFKSNKIDFYEFLDQKNKCNRLLYSFSEYLEKTSIISIEINRGNVVFNTSYFDIKIIFNGKDRRGIPFELLNFGDYEKLEVQLIKKLISGNGVCLDIGSNIGWFSLIMGKCFPNAKIISFEPIPETFKYLIANIQLNGLRNIEAHCCAVSGSLGSTDMYYAPECSVLSSQKNILDYGGLEKFQVNSITLDSFFSKEEQSNIELIKCDVEGAEFGVIKSSQNIIQASMPIIVLELFHEWSKKFNYHPDEVLRYMKDFGYLAFLPISTGMELVDKYLGEDFDRQNYFFLHKEKHKNLIDEIKD